jgi:hypothetical protein
MVWSSSVSFWCRGVQCNVITTCMCTRHVHLHYSMILLPMLLAIECVKPRKVTATISCGRGSGGQLRAQLGALTLQVPRSLKQARHSNRPGTKGLHFLPTFCLFFAPTPVSGPWSAMGRQIPRLQLPLWCAPPSMTCNGGWSGRGDAGMCPSPPPCPVRVPDHASHAPILFSVWSALGQHNPAPHLCSHPLPLPTKTYTT